jgi:hypothetical protein
MSRTMASNAGSLIASGPDATGIWDGLCMRDPLPLLGKLRHEDSDRTARTAYPFAAAFTIATTPAFIAAGSVGHAAMIAASSASSGVETLAQTLGAFSPVS